MIDLLKASKKRLFFEYLKKATLLLVIVVMAAFMSNLGYLEFEASAATTIYVDVASCPGPGTGTQADPYCELQVGINNATNGDTVSVVAGTYTEHIVVDGSHGSGSITVTGASAASTIISGAPVGLQNEKVMIDGRTGITFQNIQVRDGDYGFYNTGAGVTINGCQVNNNNNVGIYNTVSTPVTVSNTVVTTNGSGAATDAGIRNETSIVTINNNNTVTSNNRYGILSDATSVVEIHGNSVASNSQDGIYIDQSQATIYNNNVYSNTQNGIEVQTSLEANSNKVIVYDNTIYSNTLNGIYAVDSDISVIDNTIGLAGQGNGQRGYSYTTSAQSGYLTYVLGNNIKYNTGAGVYGILSPGDTVELIAYSNEISENSEQGIKMQYGNGRIIDNVIQENRDSGIWINSGDAGTVIQGNYISRNANNNTIDCHGITILITDDVSIVNNVSVENGGITDASDHYGIYSSNISAGANYFWVINNTVYNNEDSGYYDQSPLFDPIAMNNIFSENGDYGLDGNDRTIGLERTTNSYNDYYNNASGAIHTDPATPYYSWVTAETGKTDLNPYYMKDTIPPGQPPYYPPADPPYSLQYAASGYGDHNSGCVDTSNPNQLYEDAYRPPARGALRGDRGAYGGNNIYRPSQPTITSPTTGTSSSNTTPTVTGYVAIDGTYGDIDAGSKVRIYRDNDIVGEDVDLEYDETNNRSDFSVTTLDLGGDGTYTLEARVVSKLGVESPGASIQYTVASSSPVVTILSMTPSEIGSGESAALVFRASSTGTYRVERGGSGWGTGTLIATDAYGTVNAKVTLSISSSNLGAGTNTIYVYLRDGASNTGVDSTTLKLDNYAPSAITDLSMTNVYSDAAQLTWTAPGNDGSTGQASSYQVRYSLGYITDSNWNYAMEISQAPSPASAGTVESMKVPVYGAGIKGSRIDTDDDGLTDYMESMMMGSSLTEQDTDGDTYPDGTENYYGYPLLDPTPSKVDADGDGLIDEKERIKYNTDPYNPDTDGDGYSDKTEIDNRYSPLDARPQHFDTDGDGLDDYIELVIHKTSHVNRDTDSDGYDDWTEVQSHRYDPVNVFYFAIKSLDGAGNVSGRSNVAYSSVW